VAVRQCAVLVGGLGTRLGAVVADTPKPMLPVGGRPFLAWLLREALRYGIDDVVLLTGHLSAVVQDALPALQAMLPRTVRLRINEEPVRAGTGGALFHARALLQDEFLLLNGDSLLDADLSPLLAPVRSADTLGALMLRRVGDTSRYGVVTLKGGRVTEFSERAAPGRPGLINGGVYRIDARLLDRVTPVCSLERDVLPALAAEGLLRGIEGAGWFVDIGIPPDLARAQTELPRRLARHALFLDRDGVCNLDHGWVGSRDRFDWLPGAREAIALAHGRGWHVFIVTNQSGVARGHYTEAAVQDLHGFMQDQVLAAGGTIDDVRYCPYHPDAALPAYRCVSDWRKPAPGMILDLLRAWQLDPAQCCLVGDQPTDIVAATAAGMVGHLFPGGNLLDFVRPILDQEPSV